MSATTELSADGTLTKDTAEVEDKTLETFLSLVRLEVLQSRRGLPVRIRPWLESHLGL